MSHMKVILQEDVSNLGKAGELVRVRAGFGRNFLIPQGKAVYATTKSVRQLEHQKRQLATRAAKVSKEAAAISARVSAVSPTVQKRAGEGDRIYGSVTTRDIAAAFAVEGVEVDRRKIHLHAPVRTLGVFDIEVRLSSSIVAVCKLWVVSSEKSKDVLAAEAEQRAKSQAEAAARAAAEAAREAEEKKIQDIELARRDAEEAYRRPPREDRD
jgi:large subunit ribosomal protein L9